MQKKSVHYFIDQLSKLTRIHFFNLLWVQRIQLYAFCEFRNYSSFQNFLNKKVVFCEFLVVRKDYAQNMFQKFIFTLTGMQNNSKWAKFHKSPSTIRHDPSGTRKTNYQPPAQASQSAILQQSGSQVNSAQPSQNFDLRLRLDLRKQLNSHLGHGDPSGKTFSSQSISFKVFSFLDL